ncbi:MAG: HNH endonuclease [Firmicutes bacterium]|nr:HNH endonuclease [Bacillota bacterium]
MFRKKTYGIISKEDLIADLVRVADKFKSQTVTRKQYEKKGRYAVRQFYNRFGSWSSALGEAGLESWNNCVSVKKGKPAIGDRLRYKILTRDCFKCVLCGASPAVDSGVVLHVDHVVPFSRGGKTEEGNLRALCSRCNWGKGDVCH